MEPSLDRNRWRVVDADGGRHHFHPRTGLHARVDDNEASTLAAAPRVVMFGFSNACNLRCHFCSRDVHAPSHWTIDDAAAVLTDLWRAGTLEVAFGGGEPFAHRDFIPLLERLWAQTSLALHITTNGTLINADVASCIAPLVGQVRVSIYDEHPWQAAVQTLVQAGILVGANVLVTPERIGALPGLLAHLASVGCHDVALLSYVGDDDSQHLTNDDQQQLRSVIADAPLPVRVSVCFGQQLDVPLLFEGDCGAGDDFISLTPDKTARACSFHHHATPIHNAADVLQLWRHQHALRTPAQRRGCSRIVSARPHSPSTDAKPKAVSIWAGFSGNNSGECVHVARFDTVDRAVDAIDAITENHTHQRGELYSEALRDLFTSWKIPVEHVVEERSVGLQTERHVRYMSNFPDGVVRVGRVVMATTNWALDDVFPEVRAALWKKGGVGVYAASHEHDNVLIACGFDAKDDTTRDALCTSLKRLDKRLVVMEVHGRHVWALVQKSDDLEGVVAQLQSMADASGASFVAELEHVAMLNADDIRKQWHARPDKSTQQHMMFRCASAAQAAQFARDLHTDNHEGTTSTPTVCGQQVFMTAPRLGPRLGYLVARYGGFACWSEGLLDVSIRVWRKDATPPRHNKNRADFDQKVIADGAVAAARVRACLPRVHVAVVADYNAARIDVDTPLTGAAVATVMAELSSLHAQEGFESYVHVQTRQALARTMRRLSADLVQLSKR
jgi:MoaA/NifB/PqqE/SkfB family radical SAM enzyme